MLNYCIFVSVFYQIFGTYAPKPTSILVSVPVCSPVTRVPAPVRKPICTTKMLMLT